MGATVSVLKDFQGLKVAKFKCEKCGIDAACNCGAPVVPVSKVRDHYKANPNDNRSSREVAKDLGVGQNTVLRAKRSIAPDGAIGNVTRANGGTYPASRSTIDRPPKGAPWDDQDDKEDDACF